MRSTSAADAPEPILAIADLHVSYGGSRILQGVTLQLGAAPLSLVGRNGMGKTTLCQAIMGLVPTASGRIRFKEAAITGSAPHEIARRGIGYVPQGRRVFPSLSVEEHLRLASSMGRRGRWTIEAVHEQFPRLAERRGHGGAALSGGEQQMLAIARALLLNPDLLVLDEPTEGLAPVVVDSVTTLLRAVAESGVAVLLVEQDLAVATTVAERVAIMVNGTIALETTSAAIQSDEALQRRYLGVGA